MLKLEIPEMEVYDEKNEEFLSIKKQILCLEHSLLSISKWESKWHKPFLNKDPKTVEESIDYIRCMTINFRDVDNRVYGLLTRSAIEEVNRYIDDTQTATWFSHDPSYPQSREIVTSEIVYYWMVSLGIPFKCEKWHFNRLITLIRVCNEKNAPSRKMPRKEQLSQQRALNNARRQRLKSRG